MFPIFFEADPYSLIRSKSYPYYIFLFYDKKNNQNFRNKLRKDYGDFHEETSLNACVFDFDFPPREWLDKYLDWFLVKYEIFNFNAGGHNGYEYLESFRMEAYEFLQEQYLSYDIGTYAADIVKNLKFIYKIKDINLPTILVLDSKNNSNYWTRENASIHAIHSIARDIGSGIHVTSIEELTKFSTNNDIEVLEILNKIKSPFGDVIYDLNDSIFSKSVSSEISNDHISYLQSQYEEFKDLKFPERFRWKPSLEKSIRKHKDYLRILVRKINLLETNPEAGSLDLKTIRNFSRFRINDSFRALFFPKGNIKEFFAFGEHDLHL
jgi:hypothetical protein